MTTTKKNDRAALDQEVTRLRARAMEAIDACEEGGSRRGGSAREMFENAVRAMDVYAAAYAKANGKNA